MGRDIGVYRDVGRVIEVYRGVGRVKGVYGVYIERIDRVGWVITGECVEECSYVSYD